MKIINRRNRLVVADRIETARGFIAQLKGLIGRRKFECGSAMILPRCKQVHTYFMQFPIDILFINREQVVIRIIENLPRGRFSGYVSESADAIELPSHTIYDCRIVIGDILDFGNTNR